MSAPEILTSLNELEEKIRRDSLLSIIGFPPSILINSVIQEDVYHNILKSHSSRNFRTKCQYFTISKHDVVLDVII